MIRVLADANVLISGALARDLRAPSVLIFEAALDGRVGLVSSPGLLGEVADDLRPHVQRLAGVGPILDAQRGPAPAGSGWSVSGAHG